MTLDSYHSWLADRGIVSPGSQPFELFGSSIDPGCDTLILALAAPEVSDGTVIAVSRLAAALSANGFIMSWVVANEVAPEQPSLELLRSLCPTVTRLIDLTGACPLVAGAGFPSEFRAHGIDGVHLIFGPRMAEMNRDTGLKKSFWLRLQQWMSTTHS